MSTFLALYRGRTVGEASLVAVSVDPELVREFAARLLEGQADPRVDPVIECIRDGRLRALRLVTEEEEIADAE